MARKLIPIVSVIIVSIIAALFFLESSSINRELLSETITVDALYLEDEGIVVISFNDDSGKTNSVILEILGMTDTFQKRFETSNFVERVPFSEAPPYGWKTTPVTIVLEHQEFGKIGVKTEIHPPSEPAPAIIFSRL